MYSILFTHDDMDGIGCKILYELAEMGFDRKAIINGNQELEMNIKKHLMFGEKSPQLKIYFTDICPCAETLYDLKVMQNRGEIGEVQIIDHHKTNLFAKDIFPNSIIVPENELGVMESGTSLVWQYYANEFLKPRFTECDRKYLGMLVDEIRSYDTYEWKQTNNQTAKRLNTLFSLLGTEGFFEKFVSVIREGRTNILSPEELFDPIEKVIIDNKLKIEQDIINKITIDDVIDVNLKGYRVALLMKEVYCNFSELAYQFLTRFPEYDIMIQFDFTNFGAFGIRTIRDDIDVGALLAAPLGGGGHPKAAGCPLSDDMKKALQSIIIDYLKAVELS